MKPSAVPRFCPGACPAPPCWLGSSSHQHTMAPSRLGLHLDSREPAEGWNPCDGAPRNFSPSTRCSHLAATTAPGGRAARPTATTSPDGRVAHPMAQPTQQGRPPLVVSWPHLPRSRRRRYLLGRHPWRQLQQTKVSSSILHEWSVSSSCGGRYIHGESQ